MEIKQIKPEGVRIVKFEPKYAASVANMWNSSSEGWNGDLWDMTEQKVLDEELNSDSIVLNLLVNDNEKVIGYCKLEEYHDKTAIYIALLNVIPAFWGRKYGKTLLLNSLKETMNSGYNRLDLHSWSSNTKAVPLYKKMGFRWQTDNSSMYMMNFLPLILKMEILQPYFTKLDWYEDLENDLSLEPDGITRNGFEFFKYRWKKDDIFLEAVFNAETKGLCELRTNDFELKLYAAEFKQYYGKREVKLEINNYLDEPLNIEIEMHGEADIKINEKREFSLSGNRLETFQIEVKDDHVMKGHETPSVITNVKINSSLIPLKLGFKPTAPVQVRLRSRSEIPYRSGIIELFVILKNNLDKNCSFNMELIDSEYLKFHSRTIKTDLSAKQRKTIKVKAELVKGCFYDKSIKVEVLSDNEKISYIQKLKEIIPDLDNVIYGDFDEYSILRKGSMFLKYDRKGGNFAMDMYILNSNYWFMMRSPKLSQPFDENFRHAIPDKICSEEHTDGVLMRVQYTDKASQIQVDNLLKMRNDNILEHNWEIKNLSEDTIEVKHLETPFSTVFTHALYDGKLIQMPPESNWQNWLRLNIKKVTSGWYFYKDEDLTAAVNWDKNCELRFGEWWQRILYKVGKLKAHEKKIIIGESIRFNQFLEWKEYYNWYFGNSKYPETIKMKEIVVNEGNPFCDEKIIVRYSNLIPSMDEKILRLSGDEQSLLETKYTSGNWQQEIDHKKKLTLEIEESARRYSFKASVFNNIDKPMHLSKSTEQNKEILIIKGDKLEMSTSAEFCAGIFSLKYKGKELLSTSFPEPTIRGWQNHWRGGIAFKPRGVSNAILERQKFEVQKVIRKDNFGNIWQGFSYTMQFNSDISELENITVRYNYLISPSQDVVAIFCELIDTGGTFLSTYYSTANINLNEDQPVTFKCKDTVLKVSEINSNISKLSFVDAELEGCSFHLYFISNKNKINVSVGHNMSSISSSLYITDIEPDKLKASRPMFIVISEQVNTKMELNALNRIKWS